MPAFPATRLRRSRRTPGLRDLVRESRVGPADLIQPLFFHGGKGDVPITTMPGQSRHDMDGLLRQAERAQAAGVRAIALFPRIDDADKSLDGAAAWDPNGLVPRALRRLREATGDLLVIADVALDPYSSLGQDGIVVDGRIDNDRTLAALARQAVCLAQAGAPILGPSDMMDGRVGTLRRALDEAGATDVLIFSYAAKYASCFYGPFRHALDSAPRGGADKATYQMDPANTDEALVEVALDLEEGADWVMVKPGLAYLDIVWRVKERFGRPTFASPVSGEYAMIEAAAAMGALDRRSAILETLTSFKRAGADGILTYWATEAAAWLR